MWRRWLGVGAVMACVWGGWAQGAIVPVERRVDVKATAAGVIDDPAEVMVGAEYGTRTLTADAREHMGSPEFGFWDVFSTITVTSEVRADRIKVDIQSSDYSGWGGWGQANGSAVVTFDVTERTAFRVTWAYEGQISGRFLIPRTYWNPPPGGGEPTVPWNTEEVKGFNEVTHAVPETDAIYELGPGRHTLTVSQWDEHKAGTGSGGHMSIVMQAVPEPGVMGMMTVGAVGLLWRRRAR